MSNNFWQPPEIEASLNPPARMNYLPMLSLHGEQSFKSGAGGGEECGHSPLFQIVWLFKILSYPHLESFYDRHQEYFWDRLFQPGCLSCTVLKVGETVVLIKIS
jgi:hypothetical protein